MVGAYRDELEAARARAEAAEAELARLRGEVRRSGAGEPVPDDLTRHLAPGDRIVWHGQPAPWRLALPWCVPYSLWGFGLVLVVFVTARSPAPTVAALLGVLAWVAVSIAWRLRRARRTHYALTEREALVVREGAASEVRRFQGSELGDLVVRREADGGGDIVIKTDVVRHGWWRMETEVGFLSIRDVATVEALLCQTLGAQRRNRKDAPAVVKEPLS